jgi:hypothetical protein
MEGRVVMNKELLKQLKWGLAVLIILPVFFGAFSYFTDYNEPESYTASTKLALGNFDNEMFTNPGYIQRLILSSAFLQDINEENEFNVDIKGIKEQLEVEQGSGEIITIELKGTSESEIEEDLTAIVDKLYQRSNEKFNRIKDLTEQTVERVENKQVEEQDIYDAESFVYDLKLKLVNFRETSTYEPIKISEEETNPLKSAVIGAILGFALSILVIVLVFILKKRK